MGGFFQGWPFAMLVWVRPLQHHRRSLQRRANPKLPKRKLLPKRKPHLKRVKRKRPNLQRSRNVGENSDFAWRCILKPRILMEGLLVPPMRLWVWVCPPPLQQLPCVSEQKICQLWGHELRMNEYCFFDSMPSPRWSLRIQSSSFQLFTLFFRSVAHQSSQVTTLRTMNKAQQIWTVTLQNHSEMELCPQLFGSPWGKLEHRMLRLLDFHQE